MAQTIQVKRSTSTAAPTALANGELAYSHVGTNGKLFIGRPGGSAGDIDAIGGKYYVDRSETAYDWGDHALAGYLVGTSAGYNNTEWDTAYTYSQVGHLPLAGGTLTGDTSVQTETNPTIKILNSDTTIVNNQLLGTLQFKATDENAGNIVAGHIQLKSTQLWDASGDGDYGSAMHLGINESGEGNGYTDRLVLDTDGVTVSEGLDVGGDTAITGSVTVSSDLTVSGNTSLSDLTVGNITTSGYIRGPAAMVIDPSAHGDDTGTLTIAGNLTVSGTTTTINSTVVETADERIELNSAQADDDVPPSALVAGVTINRGSGNAAHILWRELSKGWYLSEDGPVDYEILHTNNWGSSYTGVVNGGTF